MFHQLYGTYQNKHKFHRHTSTWPPVDVCCTYINLLFS